MLLVKPGQHRCCHAKAAMAALQQQAASPEEALVDKVLGAEQPTGRLYRGLITALRDDAETAEGLAAARKILKALAARAPALPRTATRASGRRCATLSVRATACWRSGPFASERS